MLELFGKIKNIGEVKITINNFQIQMTIGSITFPVRLEKEGNAYLEIPAPMNVYLASKFNRDSFERIKVPERMYESIERELESELNAGVELKWVSKVVSFGGAVLYTEAWHLDANSTDILMSVLEFRGISLPLPDAVDKLYGYAESRGLFADSRKKEGEVRSVEFSERVLVLTPKLLMQVFRGSEGRLGRVSRSA